MAKGWHGDSAGHSRAAKKGARSRKYNRVTKRTNVVTKLHNLMYLIEKPKATSFQRQIDIWRTNVRTKWKPYKYS